MAIAAGIGVTMSVLSYMAMLTTLVLAKGVIFQVPPIIFILSRIGLVSAGFLLRNFKYALLIFSIAAVVLTPSTDISEMMVFMAIMTTVYGLSIVIAVIFGRKKRHPLINEKTWGVKNPCVLMR